MGGCGPFCAVGGLRYAGRDAPAGSRGKPYASPEDRPLSFNARPQSQQLLLIASSPLFGQGMSASIYLMEQGFEILVGEGYVLTVQQDEHIQIAMTRFVDGTQAMWQQLATNSPDALKRTIVRPGHQSRGS
jgi:hypothetical protein